MSDLVNHPPHYNAYPIEVVDMIRSILSPEQFQGYLLGNIIKYRMRAGLKDVTKTEEDLAKAEWYRSKLSNKETKQETGQIEEEEIEVKRTCETCKYNDLDADKCVSKKVCVTYDLPSWEPKEKMKIDRHCGCYSDVIKQNDPWFLP